MYVSHTLLHAQVKHQGSSLTGVKLQHVPAELLPAGRLTDTAIAIANDNRVEFSLLLS